MEVDVVHIGGHKAEEDYGDRSVLWVEPNPVLAKALVARGLNVLQAAIGGDYRTQKFHIANDSQASTLNQWEDLKVLHPQLVIVDSIDVQVVPYDHLPSCQLAVIDAEGSEYEILEHATKLPDRVIVELNWKRFDTRGGEEVIALMKSKGYNHKPYKVKHGHADVEFYRDR